MKTILPNVLTNKNEITLFLEDLFNNNEFFHLDDDASDIINIETKLPLFTLDESIKINDLLSQAFEVCNVWGLPIIEKILDKLNN